MYKHTKIKREPTMRQSTLKLGFEIKAIVTATLVKQKTYGKGNVQTYYIELEVTEIQGDYPPLQKLVTKKGTREGKIILTVRTYDYTKEHPHRKATWKLGSNVKIKGGSQHISKVEQIRPDRKDRHQVDFATLGRPNDKGFILVDESLEYGNVKTIKIHVVENCRNDPGIAQMFGNADFS